MEDRIEGRNPVLEALKSNMPIDKIIIQNGESHGSIRKIIAIAKEKRVVISQWDKKKMDQVSQTSSHQGVIAFIPAYEYKTLEEVFALAEKKNEPPFIILADEIEDPHNLGSIIRTANASGAHGVVIPKHRSAALSAVVAKTAAGAASYTPVVKVVNMTNTINELKKRGVWITAMAQEGATHIYDAPLTGAIGLVIGNEGRGIGNLIKKECDFLVSIPMLGEISSLNASVAAGIVMYEVVRRRLKKT